MAVGADGVPLRISIRHVADCALFVRQIRRILFGNRDDALARKIEALLKLSRSQVIVSTLGVHSE